MRDRELTQDREPTMLDRQIGALSQVHRDNAGPHGPLDDARRIAVLRLYVQWVNEALDELDRENAAHAFDDEPSA